MSVDKTKLWTAEWREYKGYAEKAFESYSIRGTTLIRQTALAGIAVVWVFRETAAAGQIALPTQLRWAAILFVTTLAADLIHPLYSTLTLSWCLDKIEGEEQAALAAGEEWLQ